MAADHAPGFCPAENENGETQSTCHRNRHQVIERAPRIQHCNQARAWLEHTCNFLLCCQDVGNMVEHAVSEDNIKVIVGERQLQRACALKPRISEPSAP